MSCSKFIRTLCMSSRITSALFNNTSYTIYAGALASGWHAQSSASRINLANTSPAYSGSTSIAFTPTGKGARLYLYTNTAHFSTLPPGSRLPSDAECAARVRQSSWEPRPDNYQANHTNVYVQGDRLTGSYLEQYGYQSRVTGNFTRTTDELIQ